MQNLAETGHIFAEAMENTHKHTGRITPTL